MTLDDRLAALLLVLAAAGGLVGCQGFSGMRLGGLSYNEKNPYAGSWTFTAKPESAPAVPGCSSQWGPFTLPVSIASDGTFDAADAKGSVGSDGSVSLTAAAPSGDLCGGGSGSGSCVSANSCRGTFSGNDGASSFWSMTRTSAAAHP